LDVSLVCKSISYTKRVSEVRQVYYTFQNNFSLL
jgi:hypothetical protein